MRGPAKAPVGQDHANAMTTTMPATVALSKLIGCGASRAAIALPVIAQTVKVLGI
jgi:hypothetical protein